MFTMTTTDTALVPSFANARRPQPSRTPASLRRVHLISANDKRIAEEEAAEYERERLADPINLLVTHPCDNASLVDLSQAWAHREGVVRAQISAGLEHATEWMLPVVLPRLPFLITQASSSYSYNDTAFAALCWTPDCR